MLKEIILVTIGGCIGFVSSFGTLMASSWLEKRGKLKVYSRFVYSKLRNILYYKGKRIAKMIQINKFVEEGKEVYYGNNGGYSFIADPRSIKRYECQFSIKKESFEGDSDFDEIKLRYFDECDNEKIFHLKFVKDCWNICSFKIDDDWNLLC